LIISTVESWRAKAWQFAEPLLLQAADLFRLELFVVSSSEDKLLVLAEPEH
jgi:hypothetical protein